MRTQLEVIAIEGGDAILQGVRKSACGDCAGKSSCSTMGAWTERALRLRSANAIGARVGDRVEVEVADRHLLIASLLLYGLPLLALFTGGGLVMWIAVRMGFSADGGFLLGATGGVALAWRLARNVRPGQVVTMIRVCGRGF